MSLVFAGTFFSWQGSWGRWRIYSEDFWKQVSDYYYFFSISCSVSLVFLFPLRCKSVFFPYFFLISWKHSWAEMLRHKTRCCLIYMNMARKMQYAPWGVTFSYFQASHVSYHCVLFSPHNFLSSCILSRYIFFHQLSSTSKSSSSRTRKTLRKGMWRKGLVEDW